ncbi:MAG: sugar ABC transporter substrate-binding protein [Thermobacillus sp.]|uniref:ABC-type sugar transport system, periplasmic component n=1 Tax=Thermobacillus composti (strain DSM 18247 / JCM 13945 / KWC4) TaxID=717605 RepID=L0EF19_THECK|nr:MULTISPECIES: extracellular solute-binding protein [Thermobacillus]AGA57755.1 ABC-type sugar transport system, periplasmic component [Thermobacillus composti KWC4]REK54462.1 MAG: sugar ABC transporter substrate-binding protein [Thermobacillus sp.]
MKKRLGIAVMVLFLALSAALAACGSNKNENATNGNGVSNSPGASESGNTGGETSGTEPQADAEPFTVSLRHIQIGEAQKFRKAILDDVVKQTEAEVPGLKFELDGVEDQVNRFTKLPAEMAAGNPPKIFDLFGGAGDALKYAKAGRLLDVTPIIEELGIADKFLNLSQFTLDGKVYGLPIGGSTEGFFYSIPLFEQYNIKVPTTWEELEAAAETLKQNGITPFAMGSKGAWVPLMMVNTLIGRYAGPEAIDGFPAGTHAWNSPEVTAAFAKYEEWVKKGYFTKGELGLEYADMLNQFVTGKAGMMFDGSWRSSVFKDPEQAGELTGKVGFFPMPPVPGGKGDQTFVNGNYSNGYGFSADLNERELAAVKAFIKNMYSEEMQLRGLLEDGVLPSMKLSDDAIGKVEDPLVKQIMETMRQAGGAFSHFDSTVSSDVYKESEAQIQKLIAGQATAAQVTEALQEVQQEANAKS